MYEDILQRDGLELFLFILLAGVTRVVTFHFINAVHKCTNIIHAQIF